jgi:hypothetical protein
MAMSITLTGQDSSITTVTKLQNGQLGNMGSILGRGRYFSPLYNIKTRCVCQLSLYSKGTGVKYMKSTVNHDYASYNDPNVLHATAHKRAIIRQIITTIHYPF